MFYKIEQNLELLRNFLENSYSFFLPLCVLGWAVWKRVSNCIGVSVLPMPLVSMKNNVSIIFWSVGKYFIIKTIYRNLKKIFFYHFIHFKYKPMGSIEQLAIFNDYFYRLLRLSIMEIRKCPENTVCLLYRQYRYKLCCLKALDCL